MIILNLKTTPQFQVIYQAVKVLSAGSLLIYPTETVYGLGADAANQKAVDKLLKFKGQRGLKPISIAVSDQKMAEKFVYLNKVAKNLYQKFLPGPLTIVSVCKLSPSFPSNPSYPSLARGISSPDSTVGIRIPDYPLILKIIKTFGRPVTATSANISGARNPWSLKDIQETTSPNKLQLIELFLDAGKLPKHSPSTIINTSREETEILRQGDFEFSAYNNYKNYKYYKSYFSSSTEQTIQIASDLLITLKPPNFPKFPNSRPFLFALSGPLGAGKTVFASGIARVLNIPSPIRSPSFILVREYKNFYHIDAWRLSSKAEFADLGLEEMLKSGNIIVLEWPQRLVPILNDLQKKTNLVLVDIKVISENKRKISIWLP